MTHLFEPIKASVIAKHLNLGLRGRDNLIKEFSSINDIKANSMLYAKSESYIQMALATKLDNITVITTGPLFMAIKDPLKENISFILTDNPRLSYIKAMDFILREKTVAEKNNIHPTAIIHEKTKFGKNVTVHPHVFIGENCIIGDNVTLCPNVVVYRNTRIGNNVKINSGTVIGKSGFGYEKDTDGTWLHFPHIGGVVIEDDVEIGSCTVIDRGALEDTVIGKGSKIDNLIHIAHAVKIGRNCVVVACTQFGGSCVIGEGTWIGPNACMLENLKIGKNCMVGVGSVIVKDVPDNTTVAGNPAMPTEELKKMRAAVKKLYNE